MNEEQSSEESMLKKDELIMQEEQPSFEQLIVKEEEPSFEHVTVIEDPSFNENMTVKEVNEEMFIHMKEEPENEDEKPLMSSVLEESVSDDYDVERPDKLQEQKNGDRRKLPGR